MMQKTKSLLFCMVGILLFSNTIFAQTGQIAYSFTSPTDHGLKTQNAILYFNQIESLFIYNKIGMDSIQQGSTMKTITKGGNIGAMYITVSPIDEKGEQVYRNFKTNSIFFRITERKPLKPYIVEDDWLPIKWHIKIQYQNIGGFKCQKAIGEFRGRIYTAWFTKEIPLSYGPWKLFGLPGLILQARTDDGEFGITLKALCYPCDEFDIEIKKPYEKELKSIKEYVYFEDHLLKNVQKAMNAAIPKNIDIHIGDPTPQYDIKEYRRRIMERSYKWEKYPGDTEDPNIDQPDKTKNLETMPESIRIKAEDGKIDKYPVKKT